MSLLLRIAPYFAELSISASFTILGSKRRKAIVLLLFLLVVRRASFPSVFGARTIVVVVADAHEREEGVLSGGPVTFIK